MTTPAIRIAKRHGVSVAVVMGGRSISDAGRSAQAEYCSVLHGLGLETEHIAAVFGRSETWVRERISMEPHQ